MVAEPQTVVVKRDYEIIAWKWMRYSGLLLIPLAWIHVALLDVIIGVHEIDLDLVAYRWSYLGWRVFDFFLLAFAFAHGMNGLRQVLNEFIGRETTRRRVSWFLFVFWLLLSIIGAVTIVGGVQQPAV
jgi:succinate dehydrogenase / fumarate reductase, membrane anchor subunit